MPERPHMYFDVDYTLIRPWKSEVSKDEGAIYLNGVGWELNLNIIQEIKVAKARGQTVIVWSQGGANWARDVVESAGLGEYVDCCLAKPSWYFDDKPYQEILDKTRKCFREF